MSHRPNNDSEPASPRKWMLVLALISSVASPGCIYRRAARVNLAKTPDSRCHQEYCNPDCTTTVDLSCIPPPLPQVADPQLPMKKSPLRIGVREAALMALNNNEVARVQHGVRDVVGVGTVYDPRVANAQRLAELGIFDTLINGNLLFPHERNPPGLSFNGFAIRPTRLDRGDTGIGISQLMRRGGTVDVRHWVDYLYVPGGTGINPQYQSYLETALTQPLLRGFGEVVTTAPIAIKASQANQSVWEFKRKMIEMVRDVEVAYWQLGAAQRKVQLIDETLPMLDDMRTKLEARQRVDRATRAQVARVSARYYHLKARRIDAVRYAQEREQLIRNLLGMPPADCQYLLLTDDPSMAPMSFDWNALVQVAVENRPEVVRQRLAVHIANLEWKVADNAYLPQLDLFASATATGLDDEIGSSWGMMFSAAHTGWNAGVLFEMPLQRTRARNDRRGAQLMAARERALLSQLGHQIVHELANSLRDISALLPEFDVAQKRLKYNDEWLRASAATFDSPADATRYDQSFDRYLRAIDQRLVAAERVVELVQLYNSSLVLLEEEKGTLLETLGLYIAGDPTEKANEKTMPNPKEQLEEVGPDQSQLGPVHVSPEFVNKGKPATALPHGPPAVDISHEYAPQPVVIPDPMTARRFQPLAAPTPSQAGRPTANPNGQAPGGLSPAALPGPMPWEAAPPAPPNLPLPPVPPLPQAPPTPPRARMATAPNAAPTANPQGPPSVHVSPEAARATRPAQPTSRPAPTARPQGPPPVHVSPQAYRPTPRTQAAPTAAPQGPPPVHVSPAAQRPVTRPQTGHPLSLQRRPPARVAARPAQPSPPSAPAPPAPRTSRAVTPATTRPAGPPPVHVAPGAYRPNAAALPRQTGHPLEIPPPPRPSTAPPVHVSPEAYPSAPSHRQAAPPTANPTGPPPVHVSPDGLDFQAIVPLAPGMARPVSWNTAN